MTYFNLQQNNSSIQSVVTFVRKKVGENYENNANCGFPLDEILQVI